MVRARRTEMLALVRAGGVSALPVRLSAAQLGASTRARQPELESAVLAMARRASEGGVLGALEAMMARPDSTNTLATITVPTLIVVGDEDILAPPVEAEQMHGLVPGSRLDVIHGAGHLSNMERPAAFNAVVSAFAATICDTAQTH
jgi:pimeloyl-ACP methyl ester carboxylesterase